MYNLTVDDAHLFYAAGVLSSNTDGEDHAADETRYACMSRPFTAPKPVIAADPPVKTLQRTTLNELWGSAKRAGGRV